MFRFGLIVLALIALLMSVNSTIAPFFIVDERERAIKLFLGEIEEKQYDAGLHWKLPVFNTIHKFDSRIMNIDANPERVLTSEKKNVMVDSFVKWRIESPRQYFKATGGNNRNAERLLSQFINKGVKDAIGKRTMKDVISGERLQIMQEVAVATNIQAAPLGVEIVDVRVKKVELPEDVSDSVYRRMTQERAKVAKDFRSKGQEKAKGIVADAERQRSVLLAEAYNESQQIRGLADAEAAEIYANAYGKDPEFYALYRSLNAYKTTFSGKNDVLLIKPDSEFFKYFNGTTSQ
ncbi:HflC protein [Chromatiales bacterium (ex Bugula neritina AB1)]|nr:HflC protein [Chromatiales bacterium (ex Bugula neritina AB1)]